jgi:hypothetical protein
MRDRAALAFLLACACSAALAHHAPNSFVQLDVGAHGVHAEMLVPASELAFALPGADQAAAFPAYLLRHVAVESPDGTPWKIVIRTVGKTVYFDHDYLVAELEITPPARASVQDFVFIDDAVTHEVRNHLVIVTRRGPESRVLGALQYPARRLVIGLTGQR